MTQVFDNLTEEILAIANPRLAANKAMILEGDRLLNKIEHLNLADEMWLTPLVKQELIDFMDRCGFVPLTSNKEPFADIRKMKIRSIRGLDWVFDCQSLLMGYSEDESDPFKRAWPAHECEPLQLTAEDGSGIS